MADYCRRCGQALTNPDSIDVGYGPDCAALLGIRPADSLPQRCTCCHFSQQALRLLYGVRKVHGTVRHDGTPGWVDVDTGEMVGVGAGSASAAATAPAPPAAAA